MLTYADYKAYIDLSVDSTAYNTSDGEGVLVNHVANYICPLLDNALFVASLLVQDRALSS